jgi:hypothetical protein
VIDRCNVTTSWIVIESGEALREAAARPRVAQALVRACPEAGFDPVTRATAAVVTIGVAAYGIAVSHLASRQA